MSCAASVCHLHCNAILRNRRVMNSNFSSPPVPPDVTVVAAVAPTPGLLILRVNVSALVPTMSTGMPMLIAGMSGETVAAAVAVASAVGATERPVEPAAAVLERLA